MNKNTQNRPVDRSLLHKIANINLKLDSGLKQFGFSINYIYFLASLLLGNALISQPLLSQNLVPNGGFEIIFKPFKSKYSGNIEDALPWFPAGIGSPDIIKSGEDYSGKANSAAGNYYAGIILFDGENKEFREYLEIKLIEPLKKGKEYRLRFQVSAASTGFAFTDELGVLLTKDSVRSKDWNSLPIEPTFCTPKYTTISDTGTWKWIEFKFKAEAPWQFMTIGNFRNDASTTIQINNKHSYFKLAYLYVDEVYIESTEVLKTSSDVGIKPEIQQNPTKKSGNLVIPNVITPNNDGFNDSFTIENLPRYSELTLFKKDGSQILHSTNYANDWDGLGFPTGKYRYELKLPDGNVIFGSLDLIKKKK